MLQTGFISPWTCFDFMIKLRREKITANKHFKFKD